jgi:hypothetical protein
MAMNIGLDRFEWTGLTRLAGGLSAWQASLERKTVAGYIRSGSAWLPMVLMVGFSAWALLFGYGGTPAESEPVPRQATSGPPELVPSLASNAEQDPPWSDAAPPVEGGAEVAPVDGLKIARQSWRRGGFGSNALVSFTLRNANDYAVRDIEISCAFTRRDGSHLTDRKRTIPDTVDMKSRKTFARMHIGFVNINAHSAKCSLVGATRI